ncbi:succinate dehydrogenase, cytochrome b556 subunit [Candidatus Blochmannia ocreatus (nom. nud.)]|uniref:Succinate dehydrogenase cytochrome b556 subunit n=1 Tax=Candidatus Blochmannia ocreatus (nom. nud.) TaxID=251538 RepID=A0ABY4SVM0_9ENTR|nr:succinate dehydrogenase, cytochrome b556 subunit [Candidatus Blochmannia ocreatus]URJ25387.1 succinate dehydrogenase, cytochrome b556 subunit [Candidatus Blochmannia ocreatus]
MMNKDHNTSRPIHLNLNITQLPISAIASIFHRISGFLLFIAIGPILWLLQLSLSSQDNFYKIQKIFLENFFILRTFIYSVIITLIYHIFAGIRQILIDFGYLHQTLFTGIISAKIIFILTILISIIIGFLIWHP